MCHLRQYNRWCSMNLEDPDLSVELASIEKNEDEIYERFGRELGFGTAGLRGILGAGTNRMNLYVIRRATQGLANYLNEHFEAPSVAIAYDSRIKSDVFAKAAAEVLSGNGIEVHLFAQLMPVPALSFAVRQLACDAGIMVTASHNPAKYNGYKVYGVDGCQMTEEAAGKVLAHINKLDIFDDILKMDFEKGITLQKIHYIDREIEEMFYVCVKAQQLNPGICARAGLKIVYTPLNGAGNIPVRRVLSDIGIADVSVVPEQEHPDGNFPTCPYPNPEIKEALSLGLALCEKTGADLLIATDPDCDRVGIAVSDAGQYRLLSGNQVGVLLLDYICRCKQEQGTMPGRPFAVKSIVSTKLADKVGAHYGVEVKNVLTGFKYIGEQIAIAEAAGEADRFLFAFEESYGYLAGIHARDKDAVVASMLIAEMAAYYKDKGKTLVQVLDALYAQFGTFSEKVLNFEFEGIQGMKVMSKMMQELRKNPPAAIAGSEVVCQKDYEKSLCCKKDETTPIDLPKSNVLEYELSDGCSVIVRPSGTEPKIKVYLSVVGENLEKNLKKQEEIAADIKRILNIQ